MDIFVIYREDDFTAFDFLPDLFKTGHNLLRFSQSHDALFCEHGHMCDAAVDIFVIHSLVKTDGRIELFYDVVHILFKSTAP